MTAKPTTQRSGALELTDALDFGEGHLAVAEDIMLAYISGTPLATHHQRIRDCLLQVRERHERVAVMFFIGKDAPAPDREARGRIAGIWEEVKPQAVATVFVAPGLSAAVGRTVMNGISRLSRSHEVFRSFGEVRDAALWLSERCRHSPGRIMTTAFAFLEASGDGSGASGS